MCVCVCVCSLTPATPRGKVKPALQMVSSVDRKCELNLKELVVAKTSSSMKYHRELLDTGREQVEAL